MKSQRKRRIYFILSLFIAVSAAVGFSLYALRQNINLYFTPSELLAQHLRPAQRIRLGGLVVKKSIHHKANSLMVSFVLTDFQRNVHVDYDGILPSLFREGQGVVVQGQMKQGVFIADQVLAKHDANYHPPRLPKQMKVSM